MSLLEKYDAFEAYMESREGFYMLVDQGSELKIDVMELEWAKYFDSLYIEYSSGSFWRNRSDLMQRSQAITIQYVANIEGVELAEILQRCETGYYITAKKFSGDWYFPKSYLDEIMEQAFAQIREAMKGLAG
ncbi:hypothetical protein [Ammoniphilus resinae]|uniref:Phage protein n=1 Tax=Ammoniphilus resinae TaxID=861532 RepID=A0ABS4GNJ2_9BACL|nr:hypothetical protein [Ammoniphilus resinae]MBP1931847.1 hypothetical protein [Ammoniphilus resinae]